MQESMRSYQVAPFFDNLAIFFFYLFINSYTLLFNPNLSLSLSLSHNSSTSSSIQLTIQNFRPFNCLPSIQLAI